MYYFFDVLHLNGRDLPRLSLTKRRAQLAKSVITDEVLRLSEELPGTARKVVEAIQAAGLEGVVAKRRDSPYRAGERSADWIKFKISTRPTRGRMSHTHRYGGATRSVNCAVNGICGRSDC